jgi:BirA family biotin operon repressor/biotin-[acetyl-CoA-carboxylase] ligase
MDEARAWLREGAPHGAVILADEQTAGRGRLNRPWQTPPGSALALSMVLRPHLSALTHLPLLGALAVAESVAPLGVPGLGIKWPNDVLVGGLKLSGVLAESEWDGATLRGAVLGIGLNLSQDFTGSDLDGVAVSLRGALGRPVDGLTVLGALLTQLDALWALVGSAALVRAWRARLITLGQRVTVSTPAGDLMGMAEDVDADGALWLRADDGTRHRVIAGDVRLRLA